MLFFNKNKEQNCKFKRNEQCEIFDSYENLSTLKKTELIIDLFRMRWGKWTIKIISWGLIIIFVAAILEYFWGNKEIPIELKIFGALQIWVGFALGIIAMIFSIISMYLSFYNLELQKDAEKNNIEVLNSLKNNIVNEIKNDVIKELNIIKKDMSEHFMSLEELTRETKNVVSRSIKNEIKEDPNSSIKNFFQNNEV